MVEGVDELIEEIVVDAHGDDEQLWSFRQWFEDHATLPFTATIVGTSIEVLAVDYDGDDRRGLIAHLERRGEKYRVSLLEITTGVLPADTARLLAAYRRWSGADARKGEL